MRLGALRCTLLRLWGVEAEPRPQVEVQQDKARGTDEGTRIDP